MSRPAAWALLGALPLLAACPPKNDGPAPLCADEVATDDSEEIVYQDLPLNIWATLLLADFNPRTMLPKQPARDCIRQPVALSANNEAAAACLAESAELKRLPDRPLQDGDLLQVQLDDKESLVWLPVIHFDNGESMGPVAMVEFTKRGVAVRAIGTLRAIRHRAKLRIEELGRTKLLVVESDKCDPDNPKKCQRVVNVVPRQGDRFTEQALLAADGSCLGRPSFQLYRDQEITMDGGIKRKFVLSRNLKFDEGAVTIVEQLVIEDSHPEEPDTPPKVFRKANTSRPVTLSSLGLVTTPGLWNKMLEDYGNVRVKPKDKPKAKPAAAP